MGNADRKFRSAQSKMASSKLLFVSRTRTHFALLLSSSLSAPAGLRNPSFSRTSTFFLNATLVCNQPSISRAVSSTSARHDQVSTVYRLPWIKHLRFISRVKILHVAIVTALTWPMSIWYAQGLVSTTSLTASIVAAAATTVGLFGLSYFLRRVVGQIDLNKDDSTVVISTLTFWGNRRDCVYHLSDIVPLTESGFEPHNIFHRLELYSSPWVYLCSLRHGQIYDKDSFFTVIGLGLDGSSKNHERVE